MRTFYTDKHRLHATDAVQLEGHPFVTEEVPARADLLLGAVREAGFGPIKEPDDFGLEPVLAVHTPDFVHFLRSAHTYWATYFNKAEPVFPSTFYPRDGLHKPVGVLGELGYYAFGVGSPILEGTWSAAYWSAQCALAAAETVRDGETAAYALCRPPGHHAGPDLYGGFCYLNNAAIAARALAGRVAILDIDYHHGNGTQMAFYNDASVLFCSLHAHPDDDYPFYWGSASERGVGPGVGFNHNWPLPQHVGDDDYLAALSQALQVVREFAPQYLVVSVGFDIAVGDPVGGFDISPAGLNRIGRAISDLAVPTVLVQEGGYLLERLGENAFAFLSAFN